MGVGDFGGLGDNGGERFVGMLDIVFLLSESRQKSWSIKDYTSLN